MTTFSTEKRRFCGGGGYGYGNGSDVVSVVMAEDELALRLPTDAESNSKDAAADHAGDEDWLQLSIGRGRRESPARKDVPGLVELDLLPSTSIPALALQPEPDFLPPFQLYAGVHHAPLPEAAGVVRAPIRPHSGVWFTLHSSQNQEKEPFLPQISKSYLRIKDGRMTIGVVIKYLVNKLSLDSESQIEIKCKGQKLLPFFTLRHVRDNIWSNPMDFITLLPNSSTTHHIMVLHYARTNPSTLLSKPRRTPLDLPLI